MTASGAGEPTTPKAVMVGVSLDLLAELEQWSPPVQILIERNEDGTYAMIARRAEVQS